ncbi:MAG TPA: MarR family transcriptional regulator [Puia sp.]|nr:MarR family transcriptional regulator [Puia sp.]
MEKLNDIIFYRLDKAIKTYRQFAQLELKAAGIHITIDQWIVLKTISEKAGISQRAIAENVFKDEASVTRIIELLVKKGLLARNFHSDDRRKIVLVPNRETRSLLEKVRKIALKNRARALEGIPARDLELARRVLDRISVNCSKRTGMGKV